MANARRDELEKKQQSGQALTSQEQKELDEMRRA